MLGLPEGLLPMTEMIIYLATAPKSNSVVKAMGAAFEAAKATPGAGVPLDVRNAPTGLLKSLGYGAGYKYAHDSKTHYLAQEYLPEELRGRVFYEPGAFGFEKEIKKRLDWWAKQKSEGGGS
jgi:putative ATPase